MMWSDNRYKEGVNMCSDFLKTKSGNKEIRCEKKKKKKKEKKKRKIEQKNKD